MTKEPKRAGFESPAIDDITTDSRGPKKTPGVRYHISVVVKEIREPIEKKSSFDPTPVRQQSQRDIVRIELNDDSLADAVSKVYSHLGIAIPPGSVQ